MDDFLTTYKVSYVPKKVKFFKGDPTPSEFNDPIGESFKNHIVVGESGPDCIEEVESFLNKAKKDYPCVAKRFVDGKNVDKSVIKRTKLLTERTIYRADYCDIDEELEYKEWLKRNAVVLPLDIIIPLTTQKSSYRDPILINSRAYVKDSIRKAATSLKPNYAVRKILNVTTGISEYNKKIGNLGKEIIEIELHGPVHHDFRRTD